MSGKLPALVLLSCVLLSGCAGFFGGKDSDGAEDTVVAQATESEKVLECVAGNEKLSRKAFNEAYKTALANANRAENPEIFPLVCLSLHQRASYKQFKEGLELLSRHLKANPESAPSLHGLAQLMQKLDREKIGKWAQSTKSMDEKEGLEAENKELQERNEALEKSAARDQARINELQRQIEQLKNIENIIKNRER